MSDEETTLGDMLKRAPAVADEIYHALVSEHGTFPRAAIGHIAAALMREVADGNGLPDKEQVELLVFGEENESTGDIEPPERVRAAFPRLHALLDELCS